MPNWTELNLLKECGLLDKGHELLTRLMDSPLPEGRTFKDMYKLSKMMGDLLRDYGN